MTHWMRKYAVKNILGEGATGVVYRAVGLDNKEVALKMVSKSALGRSYVQKEVNMLSNCHHENILSYIDYYETKGSCYIVTELCDSSLISFINEYNIDENIALKILRMILCGLHYIHSKGIIHRDIKLGNLLIKGNTVKICDFGLACYVFENNNTFCGTEDYLAPEIKSRKGYDKFIDIYSTGKVFYTLLTKRKFEDVVDPKIGSLCKDLLQRMVEEDPKKRIDAFGALSHPVFDVFMPIFPVFHILKDFLFKEKFGEIEKTGNFLRFDKMGLKICVEGDPAGMNIFDLSTKSQRAISHSEILFTSPGCTVRYSLFVEEALRNITLLTNTELKKINYGLAYTKLLMERLPLVVVEGVGYKFTYLLNKNFIYSTSSFTMKRKKDKLELTEIPGRNTPIVKDIASQYSYDKMDFLANRCDRLYGHIFRMVFRPTGQIKPFIRRINTNWDEALPFPLTTQEDRLGQLFDIVLNCRDIPSVFNSEVSFQSQTTMRCSFVDMSILKKYRYLFLDRIGWCIKSRTDFVFLMSDGLQLEVFGVSRRVVFEGRDYAIDNSLPRFLKQKLKVCLLFIKKLI